MTKGLLRRMQIPFSGENLLKFLKFFALFGRRERDDNFSSGRIFFILSKQKPLFGLFKHLRIER